MFRGQSILLGAMVCLVNVLVIAALLPDRSQDHEQRRKVDSAATLEDETAGQTIAGRKPTLEFRRFFDEEPNGFRLAEFCFVNRSQKPVFVREFDLIYVHSQVRAEDVWHINRIGVCGNAYLDFSYKQVNPGEAVRVVEYICPRNQRYVPAAGGIESLPGKRLSPDQVADMRVTVRYATAAGATAEHTVWSEPVNVQDEWRRVAQSQEN